MVKSPVFLNLIHVLVFFRNFSLFYEGIDDGTDDETDGWKGRPLQADRTNDIIEVDIDLVGFKCVVKNIEAWLQLFTSFPAL
jgi:hypothetical protein